MTFFSLGTGFRLYGCRKTALVRCCFGVLNVDDRGEEVGLVVGFIWLCKGLFLFCLGPVWGSDF